MAELTDGRLFRQTLVVLLAAGVAIIIWRLTDLILLLLAGALVAFMFSGFAGLIERRLRLPFPAALSLAVIVPIAVILFIFWAFGALMAEQFAILFAQLPDAFAFAKRWLETSDIGREIMGRAGSFMPDGSRVVAMVQSVAASLGTIVTSLVVVLVAGIYLAAQPRRYGTGLLNLVPPARRQEVIRVSKAVSHAIGSWLKAQGVSMIFVGIFTGIALSIVGIPAAPAIGLVAGLCEFVPYLGTIVVAIPAIIIGFSISPETGIWTIIAIVIVQQVQGNVVTPLVQSSMAELPPALTIFSLIAFGVLLGPMGVILAVPLTVVGLALLRELVRYDQPVASPPPGSAGPPPAG